MIPLGPKLVKTKGQYMHIYIYDIIVYLSNIYLYIYMQFTAFNVEALVEAMFFL